jgi:hypothetical protein
MTSLYEKYLKYNNYMQNGGNYKRYITKNIKLINPNIDNRNTLDANSSNALQNQNKIHNWNYLKDIENQTFKLETINLNDADGTQYYNLKHNNLCLTQDDNLTGNTKQFHLTTCDVSKQTQKLQIKEIANNNILFIDPTDTTKCLDTGGPNNKLHTWECNPAIKNQQFKIIPNFKNNDNNENHIIPVLQELISHYLPINGEECDENMPLAIFIQAAEMSEINISKTFSSIWCPLIYKALELAGENIPEEWTKYKNTDPTKQHKFLSLATKLSKVNGWAKFTMYILTKFNDNVNKGNDKDKEEDVLYKLAEDIRKNIDEYC